MISYQILRENIAMARATRRKETASPGRNSRQSGKRRSLVPMLMIAAVILCLGAAAGVYAVFGGDKETTPVSAGTGEETEQNDGGDTGASSVDADPNSGYGQLVNRTYPIKNAETYEPDDLVDVSHAYKGNPQQMRKQAAAAMEEMISAFAAQYPDLPIYTKSGYRSYQLQNTYYQSQTKAYGSAYEAATRSAIPGTSEHELGLAMDLSTDGTLSAAFESTTQGQWFLAHCTAYGFIHRYPKGSQMITGIIYEPWHFRYVGKEIAADMAKKGAATLEAYYGLYLDEDDLKGYEDFLQ